MFEEKYKTVYEGDLDANGEAYPAVKIKKNRSYNIRCAEPANTCYNKKISYTYAVQDQNNPTFLFEFAEGVYFWKIDYKDHTNKRVELHGFLTLVQ